MIEDPVIRAWLTLAVQVGLWALVIGVAVREWCLRHADRPEATKHARAVLTAGSLVRQDKAGA
jgi:hypothetical protein